MSRGKASRALPYSSTPYLMLLVTHPESYRSYSHAPAAIALSQVHCFA